MVLFPLLSGLNWMRKNKGGKTKKKKPKEAGRAHRARRSDEALGELEFRVTIGRDRVRK